MKHARSVVLCALVLATCWPQARMALAQNLVSNPDFDVSLSGWTSSSGAVWSPEDAQGQEDSGSAVLLVAGAVVSQIYPQASISTCVPVDASFNHRLGGTVYRTGRATRVWSQLRVTWSESGGCSAIISSEGLSISAGALWASVEKIVKTPENAHSARIELEVGKLAGFPGAEVIGHFDDIVFEPVPKIPSTSTTTTSTLRACSCGDPIGADAGDVTVQDAYYVLQAAVGTELCDACVCDVNDDADINVIDALLTLRAAIGAANLNCPPD